MAISKEKAKENLQRLVDKFKQEFISGRIQEYNEENTKKGFIEPLLKDVLGWDVANIDEVGAEEGVSKKRVDYSLKVDGRPTVYIEAKPPKTDLRKEQHVRQAINYGYNKKEVCWVLLTDFEEFRLFDVTVKPDKRNPEKGLRKDLKYDQYIERFEDLWLLSKESVCSGELDKLLLKKPVKERLPVDKAILEDLKIWREALAKDIYKNNPEKFHTGDSEKDANFLKECTQKILDRIIFMRSCEDRGLTSGNELKNLVEERTKAIKILLKDKFRHYNITFNSDLFMPHECENLDIDFKVLSEIILDTYNPYQFDVIPLEVLGNIYEQYLGYIPRLTDKQVKYELKPQARKAGGVYYTPEYIVDYIVKNTVGRLLKELKPKDAQKIRILDPACGSGTFLIRAYQEMLDYYSGLKKERGDKRRERERQKPQERLDLKDESHFRLDIEEKKNILLNHIFGVDIDEQAVEVTKLSLMLKMLEGESWIIPPGRSMLPVLNSNIICRNSLISGNVAELKQYFVDDWYKVKPFDRKYDFKKVMEEGGFDAVIGNPPYIKIQAMKEWASMEVEYYKEIYETAKSGNYDIYIVFLEKGASLLKSNGVLGFITPHKFFQAEYGKNLRKYIKDRNLLNEIVNFFDQQIFEDSTTYTCLLFLQKNTKGFFKYSEVKSLNNPTQQLKLILENKKYQSPEFGVNMIPTTIVTDGPWHFGYGKEMELFEKLNIIKTKLANISKSIFVGLQTSADSIYIVKIIKEDKKSYYILCKKTNKTYKIEKEIIKPILMGKDIKRWAVNWRELGLIFPYKMENGRAILVEENSFKKQYPFAWSYFLDNKKILDLREKGKWKNVNNWHAYVYEKNLASFSQPKILTRVLSSRNAFTFDKKGEFFFVGGGNAGGYGIKIKDEFKLDLKYLTALLNSKLLDFYLRKISTPFRGGFYSYAKRFIEQLPIRIIDFNNFGEKQIHDKIVALADVMLDLNKRIQKARGAELAEIQRQIEKTDREIDDLVYKLYGITEEERKIIEGTG